MSFSKSAPVIYFETILNFFVTDTLYTSVIHAKTGKRKLLLGLLIEKSASDAIECYTLDANSQIKFSGNIYLKVWSVRPSYRKTYLKRFQLKITTIISP